MPGGPAGVSRFWREECPHSPTIVVSAWPADGSPVSSSVSLLEAYSFFTQTPWLASLTVRLHMVSLHNRITDNNDDVSYRRAADASRFLAKAIERKIETGVALRNVETAFVSSIKDVGARLGRRVLSPRAGTCTFDSRLFLDANGVFHVCERINDRFPIGDAQSGFDFATMASMLGKFSAMVRRECSECIARHFCRICFANACADGRFALDAQECAERRAILVAKLESFVHLKQRSLI